MKPFGISISSSICKPYAVPCRFNYNETAQNLQIGAKWKSLNLGSCNFKIAAIFLPYHLIFHDKKTGTSR